MRDRFLILAARWNDLVTRPLVAGAEDVLQRADKTAIKTVWVPGAFELPAVAAKAAQSGNYDAIICLGAVIKGDTPHFDVVAGQSAAGLMKVSVDFALPVANGILTTNTVEEALNRAGLKMGNKGSEAALAALDTLRAMNEVESIEEREV